MTFLETILNIFFPVNCLLCKKGSDYLCLDCNKKFTLAQKEKLNWVFPLYDYQDVNVRQIIHFLKFKNKKKLAQILAQNLYQKILKSLENTTFLNENSKILLIPIPVSQKRRKERGYNQTELLCFYLIKNNFENLNFIYLKNNLKKKKEKKHQTQIKNRAERLLNVKDTFQINNPEKIKNKKIILIDDVMTTGSTLTEAKKILKEAGAQEIIAFTLAH